MGDNKISMKQSLPLKSDYHPKTLMHERHTMRYKGQFFMSLVCAASLLFSVGCSSTMGRNQDIRLIRAAELGRTQEMFKLIRAGADINARDPEGWTPYLAASSNGQFEAMRMLKAMGARTDVIETESDPRFTVNR